MAHMDRLTLFLGKPYKFNDRISIYSPTVDEIDDITEQKYQIYTLLCTFNAKQIFVDLLGMEEELFAELPKDEYYIALVSNQELVDETCSALSFFIKGKQVTFKKKDDNDFGSYMVDDEVFVNMYNYLIIGEVIKELNAMEDKKEKEEKPKKFLNETIKKMYYKMQKEKIEAEAKKKKKDGLALKDILSILCNASDNNISIFNISKMTIYQIYEQFERMGLKESYSRTLPIWANGNLGEKGKLPEWIVKTKM